MKAPLYFQWGLSTLFGWGVYGLNLLRHWQKVSGSAAYCIGQIQLDSLAGMDPLELRVLAQPLVDSANVRARLSGRPEDGTCADGLVLHSLGNRFGAPPPAEVLGQVTCGAVFFEDTFLPEAREAGAAYASIIAGSTWCEAILRANGVDNVRTVLQGVDPSIFHPAPASGTLEDRFVVFSGGKLEHRKAQDLVLLAFRAFAARHPEALLVTAWHSPWPSVAVTLNGNPRIAPVAFKEDGKVDVQAWAANNGIDGAQVVDLGSIPNHRMARVLREADVGLFPNRCEGGTNLVAMECLACGVPIIVSDNTGHKDLGACGAPYLLSRQQPVVAADKGTEGWGESDVEEIVATLEMAWTDRQEARRRGMMGAEVMASWCWRNQIGRLHDALAPFCD